MTKTLLIHIDGELPNLALMKLSAWCKSNGEDVWFTKNIRYLPENDFDKVFISTIFKWNKDVVDRILSIYPQAIVGGTGSDSSRTIESFTGDIFSSLDYSLYPTYKNSIGFTQRGCRLNCKFCVVPSKEGKPKVVNSIKSIWRGETYPKNIHLLDNDFFGQPKESWMERIQEMIEGNFKVSFNQGINVRLITDEAAEWLSKTPYYDDQFKTRRLYTAWDNLKDEKIFFRGVDKLKEAGIPPSHLLVYMLIGFDKEETWERIFYRFNKMVSLGIKPYPMVYNNKNKALKEFQRWVVRRYYEFISWKDFAKKSSGIVFERDLDDLYMEAGQ